MPTVLIPRRDIRFFFTDTGALDNTTGIDYTTLILVHGHTYHAAVFQKLLPLAAARSLRIICINRREYPGSTPHTAEELRVYASGSDEERASLVSDAGINLALAVDGIIQQCALPSNGSVALCGWSLGNTFVMAAMASILSLPSETRERLQHFVKTIIMWDAPTQSLGLVSPPNAYLPLHDRDLAPTDRGPAFAKWAGSYFIHGDLSSRQPDQLSYRNVDPSKKSTFEEMPMEELLEIVDFSVGDKCDTILSQPPFASVLSALVDKALFDLEIRGAWNNAEVAWMYGPANSGFIYFATWDVERRIQAAGGNSWITFRRIEGANHFVMWDDPSLTLDALLGLHKGLTWSFLSFLNKHAFSNDLELPVDFG
ncbi:AB hydrolase-1 domain-containing protein [Mycena sanguinolenta]|uniref:AB hydrolase-1 domain-containing protein n=1 Tax=Mycena sanguinolenta TaxID=230812 RepID=A0A8H6XX54_9AGAR|nr:AB hydrolase-1 domain-containing protein [Mycena sanguinolenta]